MVSKPLNEGNGRPKAGVLMLCGGVQRPLFAILVSLRWEPTREFPMTNWTDEEALRLGISMALSKIQTKPRGDRDGTYRRMVAEQIVAHLKLANWKFVKGPPSPRHG
jgi:hypothetical protein